MSKRLKKHLFSWRFLVIALVVGTLLNCINQGDVMMAGRQPDYFKLLLTYFVPYCVAVVSAWLATREN